MDGFRILNGEDGRLRLENRGRRRVLLIRTIACLLVSAVVIAVFLTIRYVHIESVPTEDHAETNVSTQDPNVTLTACPSHASLTFTWASIRQLELEPTRMVKCQGMKSKMAALQPCLILYNDSEHVLDVSGTFYIRIKDACAVLHVDGHGQVCEHVESALSELMIATLDSSKTRVQCIMRGASIDAIESVCMMLVRGQSMNGRAMNRYVEIFSTIDNGHSTVVIKGKVADGHDLLIWGHAIAPSVNVASIQMRGLRSLMGSLIAK